MLLSCPRLAAPSSSSCGQAFRCPLFVLRVLLFLITILPEFLAVLYLLQNWMIFPGASSQGSAAAVVHPRPGTELIMLATKRGERVAALYGPALLPDGRSHPQSTSRPALLYFYGNAMCLAYAQPELERFRRLGLNLLIPEYVGYGLSSGKPSELGCRDTAEAALEHLRARGFPACRIIAGGWSLGGAVAIDLASRQPVGGLIAFSTFTSTQEMGKTLFPIALPGWFYAHGFDSLSKLPKITCPMLLGHGRRDSLVPFPMFERLAAAAKAPSTKLVIDQADHNDFYDIGGKRIDEAITKFADQLPAM
jgi:uncharacterized protein